MNERMEKSIRYLLDLAYKMGCVHGHYFEETNTTNLTRTQLDNWINILKGEEVGEQ